jgi:hypothetical protein
LLSGRGQRGLSFSINVVKQTITSLILFILAFASVQAQTVVTGTNYVVTELECVSDYVTFPDGNRYFSGMIVKQGTRLYYLNSPYTLEVLGEKIVFDDFDNYTDRVTVERVRTAYVDMDTFKIAAVSCMSTSGGSPGSESIIDSISYYGDTLHVYAGGNPIPYTVYIDSCPCEEPIPPAECVLVLGEPDTGEVWGDPDTGVVWYMGDCTPSALAYVLGEPDTGEVWGDPDTGVVWGWTY